MNLCWWVISADSRHPDLWQQSYHMDRVPPLARSASDSVSCKAFPLHFLMMCKCDRCKSVARCWQHEATLWLQSVLLLCNCFLQIILKRQKCTLNTIVTTVILSLMKNTMGKEDWILRFVFILYFKALLYCIIKCKSIFKKDSSVLEKAHILMTFFSWQMMSFLLWTESISFLKKYYKSIFCVQ